MSICGCVLLLIDLPFASRRGGMLYISVQLNNLLKKIEGSYGRFDYGNGISVKFGLFMQILKLSTCHKSKKCNVNFDVANVGQQ